MARARSRSFWRCFNSGFSKKTDQWSYADEKYEDVNGNGRKESTDIVLCFTQMNRIAANEPAIGLSMLVQGIVAAVLEWAWVLPVRKTGLQGNRG
jgi:hypothetical protein